jgi:anaerobic selenocysteine-containing dehydrogenase
MTRQITRREFLKIGAASAGAAVLAGCQPARRWIALETYVRPPEEQLAGQATWYASTCRQCPAGCGIIVRIMNGRALKIEGNPEHPLNRGKLCARGQAGLQVLYNPDRLPGPVSQVERNSREFQPLAWNEAINTLYSKVQAAGSAVAVWGGASMSSHLYDLFRRFTSAIGAQAPVLFDLYAAFHGYHALQTDSHSLFGEAGLPAYDLSNADVVLSFGADILGTWLSATRYGLEYGEFRSQQLGKRGYLVQMEPRMTMTGAKADRWLPIRPGSEALVAQALIHLIANQAEGPADRIARARALASPVDLNQVASASDLTVDVLAELARTFITAERPLAIPGSTLSGQADATGGIAAVQALNLIAGTLGEPGGLLLPPISPLPEVTRPASSSLEDVERLIERMRSDQVEMLLVHSANPAYDLPDGFGLVEAISHVPFVVSFSPIIDETAVWADLVLPDRTYLESWGYQVVSPNFGTPVIGGQQPVVTPVFDARSTGDILLGIAKGIPAAAKELPWIDEVEFLKETIGHLPPGAMGGSGSDLLWARFLQHGGWWPDEVPESVSPAETPLLEQVEVMPAQFQGNEQDYPYYLHLYMSELLSDGSGASQPWLQGSPAAMTTISWQTWVELNPTTANNLGVGNGDIVRITTPQGEIEAPVYIYPAIRPDTVAIPLGQGHSDYGRYGRERGSNPLLLIGADTDSLGHNLAWATLRASITPTGKKQALATFENTTGVTEGFPR